MDPISSSAQSAASSFNWGSVIGAGVDAAGSIFGSLFNANQARKNRQFQERMYNQQVQDNRNSWMIQQLWNSPANQKRLLEEAGLNPLLMYSNGASGSVAASPSQAAGSPSGGQASTHMGTNFGQAILQGQLLQAQIANINADTEQKTASAESQRQTASNLEYDLLFKKLTQNLNIALKHGNLDQIFAATDNLRQQIYASKQMTLQSVLSMMQAREYEIKRFNLDSDYLGTQLEQRWQEIATGRIAANAQMKNACAALLSAQANWNLSNAQVGQIALNMSQSREMFPLLYQNQENVNWSQVLDRIFKGVQISNEQKRGLTLDMDNYLKAHGAGTDTKFYQWVAPFIIPALQAERNLHYNGNYRYTR